MHNIEFKLCVSCMTFNQSRYIEDAMRGFVMQKTDFPYMAAVVDDASTDGEQEVIKCFLEKEFDMVSAVQDETEDYVRVVAKHKTNVNCTFVVILLKYNHYKKKDKTPYFKEWRDNAKYIALCEGDDYWTHPLKLQRQVDFLEEHEEYSLCCHRYRIFNEITKEWEPDYVAGLFEENPEGFSFTSNDNLHCWITKTMTLIYRKSALPNNISKRYRYYRDVHQCYHLLQNGPGFCMPDDMAVYRKQQGGVFSSLNDKEKKRINLLIYHEILKANPNDVELGIYLKACYDRYFGNFVRKPIYDHQISREVRKDIQLVVDGYKFWMGRKSNFFVLKKCVKSYCSGFRRKNGSR